MTLVHHLVTRPNLEVASCKAADVNGCMERSLRNAQTLEAMGMLVNLQERWLRQRNEALHMQARAADRTGLFAGVTKSVRFLLQVVLLGCGALLVIDDEITPGAIVAASMLMARALTPLETTIGAWRQCVGVRAAYARLNELLRRSPPRPKRISLPAPRGALRVEDVVAAARQHGADPAGGQFQPSGRRCPGGRRRERIGQVDAGAAHRRRLATIRGESLP